MGRTHSLGVQTGLGCGRRVIAAPDSTVTLTGIDEEENVAGYIPRFSKNAKATITQEQAEGMAAHGYHEGNRHSIHLPPELNQNEEVKAGLRALQQLTGETGGCGIIILIRERLRSFGRGNLGGTSF